MFLRSALLLDSFLGSGCSNVAFLTAACLAAWCACVATRAGCSVPRTPSARRASLLPVAFGLWPYAASPLLSERWC